jgi:hypothetical protein
MPDQHMSPRQRIARAEASLWTDVFGDPIRSHIRHDNPNDATRTGNLIGGDLAQRIALIERDEDIDNNEPDDLSPEDERLSDGLEG